MNAASASAACQLLRCPGRSGHVVCAAYSPMKTFGPLRSYLS